MSSQFDCEKSIICHILLRSSVPGRVYFNCLFAPTVTGKTRPYSNLHGGGAGLYCLVCLVPRFNLLSRSQVQPGNDLSGLLPRLATGERTQSKKRLLPQDRSGDSLEERN